MFRLPRINVASLSKAVRSINEGRASQGMRDALYSATKTSPVLAKAVADAYPFTFCAHEGCDLPIAHDGSHLPVAG